MNKQLIFGALILISFNFLLLNIFKLQKEISGLEENIKKKDKENKAKNTSSIQGGTKYPTKYKEIDSNTNTNTNTNINSKLNDIANLSPIDINKIDKTKTNFISKDKQVETI